MRLGSWSWRRVALLWIAGVVLELGVIIGGRAALDGLMFRSLETLEDLPGAQQQEVQASSTLDVRDSASIRIYTWKLDSTNAAFQRYERLDDWSERLMWALSVVVLAIPSALVGLTVLWFWQRRRERDVSRWAAT